MCGNAAKCLHKNFSKYILYISGLYANLHVSPRKKTRWTRNNEARSCSHYFRAKSISIECSECMFSALSIQHAMHTSHIVTLACPAVQCFTTLSRKLYDFQNRSYWTKNVCFDLLYSFCLKHFSFQEEPNEIWSKISVGLHENICRSSWKYLSVFMKISVGLHEKCPLFLSDFNEASAFWHFFRKILKYKISCNSVQSEKSGSMRTDGRTDRHDEANSRFSQFFERT